MNGCKNLQPNALEEILLEFSLKQTHLFRVSRVCIKSRLEDFNRDKRFQHYWMVLCVERFDAQ